MRVLKDQKAGTYTLVPTELDEFSLVASLLSAMERGQKLQYHGQVQDEGEPMVLRFNAGGKYVDVPTISNGKVRGTEPGFEGGVTFNISAPDEQSQKALGPMRDMCFFATSGLIFIEEVKVDDVLAICCTGGFCKHCHSPMIGIIAGNDGVCDTCSKTNCEHEYEHTVFLSPAFGGMVAGELCKHCKRVAPSSFDRLKQTPRLQRLEEATALVRLEVPNFHHFLGHPGDSLCFSIEEAVALRDHGTVPEYLRELVENNIEAKDVLNRLAQDMRERV